MRAPFRTPESMLTSHRIRRSTMETAVYRAFGVDSQSGLMAEAKRRYLA